MITQKFVDDVVPFIRARLKSELGLDAPAIPVIVAGRDVMSSDTNMGYTKFEPLDPDKPLDRVPVRVVIRADRQAETGAFYAAADDRAPFAVDCSEQVWAAGVLTHELIHSALSWTPMKALFYRGHDPEFLGYAAQAGLYNDAAAFPGPEFKKWYDDVVAPAVEGA